MNGLSMDEVNQVLERLDKFGFSFICFPDGQRKLIGNEGAAREVKDIMDFIKKLALKEHVE